MSNTTSGRHGIEIGLVHVRAGGVNPAALLWRQLVAEQRRGARFAAILAQPDDFAVDDVREDGPEPLPFAALDLIEADVPRARLGPLLIPPAQEGDFGAPGRAPTHATAHRRMAGRHRLTVDADQLLQAARDPCLRIGKLDALGPNATVATPHAPLAVDHPHRMRCPR